MNVPLLIFRFLVPPVIYGIGLWWVNRSWRNRYHAALMQSFVSEKMQQALLHRLIIRGVYCEVCHERFEDEQAVVLRIGRDNEIGVLAHGLCLGPLP